MKFKPVKPGRTSNPFEAFRQLVYLAGVPELAQQMGTKPGTLYNKADADEDTHHQPTLKDVVLSTRLTGDMRVLDALNAMFGRAAYDITHFEDRSDEDLMELLTTVGVENGELHQALRAGLRNPRFGAQDFVLIESEAMDVVGAVLTLVHRVRGLIDE